MPPVECGREFIVTAMEGTMQPRTSSIASGLFGILLSCFARADVVPMYQLYHGGVTDFFYTISPSQKAAALGYGYADRGTPFYVNTVRIPGAASWQRFYKGPPQNEHFYTWTQADVDVVTANGWLFEGIEGNVMTAAGQGVVALHRFNKWNPAISDLQHYYTTNYQDSLQPWMSGWGYDGIVGYVWTAPQSYPYAAAFISQSVPTTMELYTTQSISITMKNVGTATWLTGNDIYLATASPQDNLFWCVQDQRNQIGNPIYNRVNLPNAVAPGQAVTFNFAVKPNSCLGYATPFTWRMLGSNVTFASEDTPVVNVNLVPPTAQFVSQKLQTGQIAGRAYTAQVTMKNVSSTETWSAAAGYVLLSQSHVTPWGSGRIAVPATVGPGQTVTFNISYTAPAAGTYAFQWRMAQGRRSFGQATPPVTVSVAGSPADFLPAHPAPTWAPPFGSLPYYPPF
jgi:hypothetical protein